MRPSTIIVQAPQAPRSQTRLLPVRSARMRRASSSVTRGSIVRSMRLPFDHQRDGHFAGPDGAGPRLGVGVGHARRRHAPRPDW